MAKIKGPTSMTGGRKDSDGRKWTGKGEGEKKRGRGGEKGMEGKSPSFIMSAYGPDLCPPYLQTLATLLRGTAYCNY